MAWWTFPSPVCQLIIFQTKKQTSHCVFVAVSAVCQTAVSHLCTANICVEFFVWRYWRVYVRGCARRSSREDRTVFHWYSLKIFRARVLMTDYRPFLDGVHILNELPRMAPVAESTNYYHHLRHFLGCNFVCACVRACARARVCVCVVSKPFVITRDDASNLAWISRLLLSTPTS
jgi:hypothetical protein